MRKKTIEERLQEELKYSEVLNSKIKKLEKKEKERKQKSKNSKNNFEFFKEYKYLKEQQKKIENELIVQLFDITPNIQGGDELMKEYYQLMNFEKDISLEFKNTLGFLKDNIIRLKDSKELGKSKEGIKHLFKTLEDFNNNIIKLSQDDYNSLTINDTTSIKDKEIKSESNEISLIIKNDIFNSLGITNIDYLITQELEQAEINKTIIIPFNHTKIYINQDIKNKIKDFLFSFPFTTNKINPILQEKALIFLGENKGEENIKGISKSFELVNLKYKHEKDQMQKNLIKQLIDISKQNIPLNIKLKCSNMLFFIKNFDNSLSITQKLSNIGITSKNIVNQYTTFANFLEYLFNYKKIKKGLTQSYLKEISELKVFSSKVLNEEIEEEITKRKEIINQYDFNQRKKEMSAIHQKNKEIYEVMQKIKDEKKRFDDLIKEKQEKEKESKQRQYNELNKLKTEQYKEQKKENEKIQQEKMRKEQELLRKKQKEEIKKHLPYIIQNQINSTNKFINNQMHKKFAQQAKEFREAHLNNVIENLKCRPKVEADSERLISITKNLENRYQNIQNGIPDQDEKVKMYTNNGFTVEHLMKDFRYKVSCALYEAGLVDKDYSKQLMRDLAFVGTGNGI